MKAAVIAAAVSVLIGAAGGYAAHAPTHARNENARIAQLERDTKRLEELGQRNDTFVNDRIDGLNYRLQDQKSWTQKGFLYLHKRIRNAQNDIWMTLTPLRCHFVVFEDESLRFADPEEEFTPCMNGDPEHAPHFP